MHLTLDRLDVNANSEIEHNHVGCKTRSFLMLMILLILYYIKTLPKHYGNDSYVNYSF